MSVRGADCPLKKRLGSHPASSMGGASLWISDFDLGRRAQGGGFPFDHVYDVRSDQIYQVYIIGVEDVLLTETASTTLTCPSGNFGTRFHDLTAKSMARSPAHHRIGVGRDLEQDGEAEGILLRTSASHTTAFSSISTRISSSPSRSFSVLFIRETHVPAKVPDSTGAALFVASPVSSRQHPPYVRRRTCKAKKI